MIPTLYAIPNAIEAKFGGIIYARKLLSHLPQEGIDIQHIRLARSPSFPSRRELAVIEGILSNARPDAVLLIDSFIYSVLPADLIRRLTRPIVAVVHHPLSEEGGLSDDDRIGLLASERAALALAQGVIAASPHVGRVLIDDFGVRPERLSIAPGGTAKALRARGTHRPVQLVTVGAISARKNHLAQIAALAELKHLDWHLNIVGSLVSRSQAELVVAAIKDAGLLGRVQFFVRADDETLAVFYDRSDAYVSTSLYEGYGLALTEALARGLPIVMTTGGAAPQTVPDDAAIKVASGDTAALRDALECVITDVPRRRALAQASWEAGSRLTRWSDTAAQVARVIRAVSPVARDEPVTAHAMR